MHDPDALHPEARLHRAIPRGDRVAEEPQPGRQEDEDGHPGGHQDPAEGPTEAEEARETYFQAAK
eukprot:12078869-Prorocentrum_lima.AAC.1